MPTSVSISDRANGISDEQERTFGRPTTTHREQMAIATELFAAELAKLQPLAATDVVALERELERVGAPYTPGRIPQP